MGTIRDVTNQKIKELYLKENEEKYRTLFKKNLAGVYITENRKIIDCNNSFAKIFGYKTRVELIGKNVYKLYFSKQDRDNYLKELKIKGYLTNYRLRNKNKKGEEIWILTNTTLVGENRIEGTLIDITEQVKAESLLKQNEKNYKDLTENSPYGIFVHKDGYIYYANKKATQILGIKTTDKINIFKDIFSNNQKEAKERAKKVLSGEEVPFKEFKITVAHINKPLYLEIKPVLFDYQGQKLIQVVFKDITAEKELSQEKLKTRIAEESNKILQNEIVERTKIEKKLIENQQYTNSIINSSLDIICSSDTKGKIIEFNTAAEKTFGYKKKEIISKGVSVIYATKQEFLNVSKQLKNNGIFVGEVQNKRKNGELFTSFLSASVLYNEKGKSYGTMGVSRDVTQLKIVEQQLIEGEEKYRDLFENATHIIQSVDKKGNILYVNKAWKKTLGYTDKEIEKMNIFDIIHPDCIDKCKQLFSEIIKSKEGKTNHISYDFKTKTGKKIIVEGNVSVKYINGKPDSTRAILRDVTEEMWDKLLHNTYNNIAKIITEKVNPEEIYEAIRIELGKAVNTAIFAISYVVDKDTLAFPYYYDETRNGRIIIENRYRQKGLNEYLIKFRKPKIIYREEWDKIIIKGEYKIYGPKAEVFIGVPLKVKNKVIGVVSIQSYNNKNLFGEKALEILDFISGILALTVQRKYDEQLLFEQTSKLKSIIENSTHLFWTYDKNIGLTSFNQNYSDAIYDLYGTRPQIILGEINKIKNTSLQPFWDKKYVETYKGKKVKFITERINKKGKRIIREVFLNPIFDEANKVVMVSGIAQDITDKQIAGEKLLKSLNEKEILLKEVHHRVKNNLQVISSILSLQSSYIKEENVLNILKESKNRIKTMAFIHESLYQTNDFSKINFSEYVANLSKNLVHSYGILDNYVDLNLVIDDVSLNLDLSIPCGLIINELVSNALKYAFSNTKKGVIKIGLFEDKENINLIVQDNGRGLPKHINYQDTKSLGLQLVMTLVDQINGTIKLDNTKGAKYTIIFKKIQ
ncbi:MAG: hypothetical protein A3K10_15215 [Bacteroidetes bacterium RIFCSPLOWO2_12_FULL_31_6]|nr:MAG: hypothetical protein A3K10_15215 [Bacteroidetes bacterium RIFCSPLOWO2_12_FULL_31_6]